MNKKTVGIVGVGNVGSTLAFTLATKNICSTLLLKDLRENFVKAMALDISQATNAAKSKTITKACLKDEDFKDCDVVVITAGIARKPGMSRDDLLLTNAKIITDVIKSTIKYNPNAIIIIVSNPLDAMVYTALKASNYPRNKIVGMAGILDSARMAHFIFEKLGYGQGQIEASVMGGHGDDMVPLADFSTVAGVNLSEVLSKEDIEDIVKKTKNGGAQIVKLLETGSAYYAPAYSTTLMIEAILEDKRAIYPCAVMLEGEYGYNDIVSGVPVMLGMNGVEKVIELKLKDEQKEQFAKSIASVQELINVLKEKKMKQTFEVLNVKCGGCANTLIKSLKDEFGEVEVNLDLTPRQITLDINDDKKEALKVKLRSLGYPLTSDELSGFEKAATTAKSFVSCAIGKFDVATSK